MLLLPRGSMIARAAAKALSEYSSGKVAETLQIKFLFNTLSVINVEGGKDIKTIPPHPTHL